MITGKPGDQKCRQGSRQLVQWPVCISNVEGSVSAKRERERKSEQQSERERVPLPRTTVL